ncbi:MAG: PAS domain S-box protein [Nitrospira sp.]|nr:PAS domain S-box protein [Nitrospira sp.]
MTGDSSGSAILAENPPQPARARSTLRAYGVGVACAAGAILLRALFDPVMGPQLPVTTLFGFVALATWYGGWGPGLLAALVSYLAANWLFIEPRFAFSAGPEELWGFGIYLSTIAVIIAVIENMRPAPGAGFRANVNDAGEEAGGVCGPGPSRTGLIMTVGVPVAGLLLIAGFLLWQMKQLLDASGRVAQTDEVIMAGENHLLQLVEMESGLRGYLLTADRRFLEPYEQARQNIDLSVARLHVLVSDNRPQVLVVEELQDLTAQWKALAERMMTVSRRGQADFALQDQGKHLIDGIRNKIAAFLATERTLRDERSRQVQGRGQFFYGITLSLLLGAGTLIALLMIHHLRALAGTYEAALRTRDAQAKGLRESEARLRFAQQAGRVGTFEVDLQAEGFISSQGMEALYGLPPGEFPTTQAAWESLVHPQDRPRVFQQFREANETGERDGEEFRVLWPDGSEHWLMGRWHTMIQGTSGFPTRVRGVNIDITDRKQGEQAVANLASIVTSSDDSIIGIDLRGIVTSWNHAAERLFGHTAKEMIGHPVLRLISPERQDEESHILERIVRGEVIERYETARRRKDGTELIVSLTVSPVVNSQGKIIGASKIARDITDQKRVEESLLQRDAALTTANDALKRQSAALAESNKDLESFSYSVSHDLRAPLRTIDAFSRIVEEDHGLLLNAEARRCLTIIRKASAQAGELIDDLLELSRLGRQGLEIRLVTMTELAREAADELRIVQENRTIELTLQDLPCCHGDRRLLKLVWSNLVTNAFKYTRYRDEARIEVGWLPDEMNADAVTYYIKDNGVGFDMKYAHKLFGVFQRLHRKEDFEGTGVGLAIVQRIVHRHGGRVWAEGKIDCGATFFFSLRKATA